MATRTLDRLQRLRVQQESTFASELSGSLGSFEDIRIISAEAQIEMENLDDEATTQRTLQTRKKIRGRDRVESLDIEVDFLPTGTALDSGASPGADPSSGHGIVLQAVLGGYEAAAGTTEDGAAASTTTALEVTDATNFSEGSVVGAVVGGTVEVRDVVGKSGTTLTPRVAFSAAPDDGGAVYNSYQWYVDESVNKPLQFIAEKEDRNSIHWLLGCALTGDLGFSLSLAELVRMSFGLSGAKWLHDDDVGTPLAGAETSLQEATYNEADIPLQFIDSTVIFAKTTGGTPATYASIPVSELSIEPSGITHQAHMTPGGTNGISRYQMVPERPVATASFTAPLEADELRTYEQSWYDEDYYTLSVQFGTTAGKITYISLPSVQITSVQPAASGDYAGYTVTVEAHEDQDQSDFATTKKRSPIRIASL